MTAQNLAKLNKPDEEEDLPEAITYVDQEETAEITPADAVSQ